MIKASRKFSVGARKSALSKIQTESVLSKISSLLNVSFETTYFSSPGDRDRTTDLKESSGDFFTRDLDEALLSGVIDCAVHSAKDLAYPVRAEIDWCWLPWKDDPRDVLVLPAGFSGADVPKEPRIGVSSERRERYAASRFPQAHLLSIRGNVPSRIEQLDHGNYDAIITSAAAVHRLGREERITEYIETDVLPTPAGQGSIALTFRRNDPLFRRIRSLFVTSVVFVGAGVGRKACTIAGVEALRACDVCLHDTLMDYDILKEVCSGAEIIDVGKRCGKHTKKQDEINALLVEYVRRGKRVVRLKGGDPGIFGRLAEEIHFLESYDMAYRVIPGISSLSAATTGTGMLLTRRGFSRGFCVMTPREQGGGTASVASRERASLPIVFFMSISVAGSVIEELLNDGFAKDTKAAFVFNAGSHNQLIIQGTLAEISKAVPEDRTAEPGLFIVGDITGFTFRTDLGALAGNRVLLTSSAALQAKSEQAVLAFGGNPVMLPLISTIPEPTCIETLKTIKEFDWVILTSPSSVRAFFELYPLDIRALPKIMSCGTGTTRELHMRNIHPDAQPQSQYSTETLIALAKDVCDSESRILRLRSDLAGEQLSSALRDSGFDVTDSVLYTNKCIEYDMPCPEFDAVFFASTSAVHAFIAMWGKEPLLNRIVCCIGKPTANAVNDHGAHVHVLPEEATVESSINALAAFYISRFIEEKK